MIYNRYFYLLFCCVAVAVVAALRPSRYRHAALLAMNLVFVAHAFVLNTPSMAMLLALLATNFALLKQIPGRTKSTKTRLSTLIVGLNVAALIVFDHPNLLGTQGSWFDRLFTLVGLSLLILRLIHLAVDLAGDAVAYPLTAPRFFNFTLFFPAYFSGPIIRYDDFLAGFEKSPSPDAETSYRAVARVITGLFKLQVLAFLASYFSLDGIPFVFLLRLKVWMVLCSLYFYTALLYLSFSGTIDIAIGFSALMGVRLPENFDHPFRACNIQDFWRRWHISLLDWIRDYVYYPLLGVFHSVLPGYPVASTVLTIFLTLSIFGSWHGQNFHYLAYGLYHAMGLVLFYLYTISLQPRIRRFAESSPFRKAGVRVASWVLTWNFISLGWLFHLDRSALIASWMVRP